MLYVVGVGLVPGHVTKDAIDVIKGCERVLIDVYTVPAVGGQVEELEEVVGRKMERAERSDLEEGAEGLVEEAREKDVAVVTFGDPLTATTHVALTLVAEKKGVAWRYVPGISIFTYVPSRIGLEHYKFGWTVTIPHQWRYAPSFYDRIRGNLKARMHTLVLLDVGEKAMGVREGLEAIIYWAERIGRGWEKVVGVARAGHPDEKILYGNPEDLLEENWPDPPHSLVIPGKLHPVEEEALRRFARGER